MRSAALINYDIVTLEKKRAESGGYLSAWDTARLERCRRELPVAKRRELKRLARTLTLKADIYATGIGRIFACDARFIVRGERLFHGTRELDPATLCDGHGRTITADSD